MPDRTPAPPTASASASPSAKAAPGAELAGEWVEFWALSGGAETQRYVFGADGRFEWHAAPGAQDAVLAAFGAYAFNGAALDLTVTMERPRDAACDSGCRKPVEPARALQLAVTECPPNEEARALDASYRCLSFGDRAFWLRRPN